MTDFDTTAVPGSADTDLRQRVRHLIVTRAMVSTVLLGGATVLRISSPGAFSIDPLFFLIALTYGLTIFYAATLRHVERHGWLVDVQLAADAIIVSAFIWFTGGISSVFSLLYVLPIIAGSVVGFRRGGMLVATLSSVVYIGLVIVQYLAGGGLLDAAWAPESSELPSQSFAEYTVALNVFGFVAVAFLSGSLSERVRATSVQLERAAAKIAGLQALNQHVIDSLPSGLLTTDTQQRIVTFNHAAEAICGHSFAAVEGRRLGDVLPLPGELADGLDRGHIDVNARRVESRLRRPDGREIDIGLTVTYLETPQGRSGFLVTFQDLTDIKRLENHAQLQQRLAAVGEMAAGIAHEIRNPLASMSGSIQILRHELPLSTEQEQLMDIVLRESERLNTTIRSFLDYARPQRFAVARFDVRRVLNDAGLLLRNSAEVHDGHTIVVDLPSEAVWYEADEGQIKQIVWNLATNGLRAMPDGGRLRLSAAFDSFAGAVVLTVQDDGVGIPPEQIDALFQPFHGTFAKGTGLGLAIVHRTVTDYKGSIEIQSKKGEGTRVSVRLPVTSVVAA